LVDTPDRLWRRLAIVAFEDVGLASIDTLGIVTFAHGGKRMRASLGGEWSIASLAVALMVRLRSVEQQTTCSPMSKAMLIGAEAKP
jgi:replication-associated recombination protein RarA